MTNLTMNNFSQKLESFQYNAALTITGTKKRISQDNKLYKELGLQSLKFRRRFRKLCTLLQDQKFLLTSISV